MDEPPTVLGVVPYRIHPRQIDPGPCHERMDNRASCCPSGNQRIRDNTSATFAKPLASMSLTKAMILLVAVGL
ncbi:MAG TPA: hypothetical protein VFJ48_11155 [Casimicrobiaceae bacterium]|nr:hypothetical protein [Casimicrobiaceae bacterium]